MPALPRLVIALLGLLSPSASSPVQAQETFPWYQIELIVFRHQEVDLPSDSRSPDPGMPITEGTLSLQTGGLYALLPDEQLRLIPQRKRLDQSGAYQTLLHLGWRQPVQDEAQADRLYFQYPLDTAPALEPPTLVGVIRVGLQANRRLLAHLDFLYRDTLANHPRALTPAAESTAPVLTYFPSYRLQERRPLASGELHYLDHPPLGVLLLTIRLEATPEPVAGDSALGLESSNTPAD